MRAAAIALFTFAALSLWADPNTLTPEEKAAGWRLLFDGHTFTGWVDPASRIPASDSWHIRDGCLEAARDPRMLEDMVTADRFADFELAFEWRLEAGGNSGVKYRIWDEVFLIHEKPGYENGRRSERARLEAGQRGQTYNLGFEFQLIDDEKHPDALRGAERRTGALYGLLAPPESAGARAGEWNTARLVVKGMAVEHWINGKLVLKAQLDSEAVEERVARRLRSNESRIKAFRERRALPSPIAFQNHGDSVVWFRGVKIRELR